MTDRVTGQGLRSTNGLVRIVASGEIIQPITDEMKTRKGFVDVEGRPKRSKVSLLPTDQVKVVQFELYLSRHRCSMCNSEGKSQRVLLLENSRTGNRFYAAGDCLRYHFDREIDVYFKSTRQYRRVLEKVCGVLGIAASDGTTQELVEAALAGIAGLPRYRCDATADIEALLDMIRREPSRAAGGELDDELRSLAAFIDVHLDFADDPIRHADRWQALLGHPVVDKFAGEQVAALEIAVSAPSALRLPHYAALLAALEVARRWRGSLRNPAVSPWEYPDRGSYHQALRRHYEMQPFNEPRAKLYSVVRDGDQKVLGSLLLRAVEKDDKSPVTFWLTATAKTQIQNRGVLPNKDTLVDRGAQIVRTGISAYHEKPGDSSSLRYRQGVCVYYIDLWHAAYEYWHRYRASGGRDVLEALHQQLQDNRVEGDRVEPMTARDEETVAGPRSVVSVDEAEQVVHQLPGRIREVFGVDPTEDQLEVLRKPWLAAYYAERAGDAGLVAEANERLRGALVYLGLAAKNSV